MVISIIGMLVALLLPAVNAARETARSANCLSNMTNLGKALISYDARQGNYPGYINTQAQRTNQVDPSTWAQTGSALSDPIASPTGWVFPLLTYLDRNDLAEQYGQRGTDAVLGGLRGAPPRNVTLKVVQCPSDINATDEGDAGSSYVVNCGFEDIAVPQPSIPYCTPGIVGTDINAGVSPDYPANGVFHNQFPFTGLDYSFYSDGSGTDNSPLNANSFKIVKVSSSTILSGDGTTNTMILSENVDGGEWTDILEQDVGFVSCPAGGTSSTPYTALKAGDAGATLYGSLVSPARTVQKIYWINEKAGQSGTVSDAAERYRFSRPSSYHANGVNVFFAGGNGRFLADTIDPAVYAQLMSVHGTKMVVPSKTGPVQFTSDWNIFAKPLSEGSF
ncbi:MAG: DUF1559 domain-containing protein [Pirellulales bacterium]|nr:DUF1559 domain-containing protein [Pirellulales bacterium]